MTIHHSIVSHLDEALERVDSVRAIILQARDSGMSPTLDQVHRQYAWWLRWYTGAITKGYLMKATGIRNSHGR